MRFPAGLQVDGIPVLLPDGSMNSKFAVFIVTYIMSVGWVVLQAAESQSSFSPLSPRSTRLAFFPSLFPSPCSPPTSFRLVPPLPAPHFYSVLSPPHDFSSSLPALAPPPTPSRSSADPSTPPYFRTPIPADKHGGAARQLHPRERAARG